MHACQKLLRAMPIPNMHRQIFDRKPSLVKGQLRNMKAYSKEKGFVEFLVAFHSSATRHQHLIQVKNVPNLESKLSSFSQSLASELSSLSSHSSASKCSHSSKMKEVTMTDTELLRQVQQVARSRGLITTYAVKFVLETSGTISTANIIVETKMKTKAVVRIRYFISRAA